MTESKKTPRKQSAKSKAKYAEMRKKLDDANAEKSAARKLGISVPRKHYIHEKYKINDPNYWRDLSIAMVDKFVKSPAMLGSFEDALAELENDVKTPPTYRTVADKETVDSFDPLMQVMAFVFGVAAVTEPSQVTSEDLRRAMASINSVKRSLIQYRKHSVDRSESERKQKTLQSIRRADVRKAAQYAVENDIDPFDLGLITDPKVIDTVTEMYRIMKMQRNQAKGQNALATARLDIQRKRVRSLMGRYRTLLKKSKGPVTADVWYEEELERHKQEDEKLVEERKAELWNMRHPKSKKYRNAATSPAKERSSTPVEKSAEDISAEDEKKQLMDEIAMQEND